MRWVLSAATLVSWVICFTRDGAGAMAIWLFVGIVGAMGSVMAFVQARIHASSRAEVLHEQHPRRAGHKPAPRP